MDNSQFVNRHVGISDSDQKQMLSTIGVASLDELIDQTIPSNIKLPAELDLPEAMTERELEEHIAELGSKNKIYTSYIGQGWYDTVTPAPIRRGVLENAVWYTSYTPYQAEISQGRLEALFNFQNVVTELSRMELTNCSLLDEATAGAEAVMMLYNERSRAKAKAGANVVFLDDQLFEPTKAVIRTRVLHQGMEIVSGDWRSFQFDERVFAAVIQYPDALGEVHDYRSFVEKAHAVDAQVAVAADLMSLVLLTPPAEWGADAVFGSTQRFGIPMYYGGPSAGYLAAGMKCKRTIPGRIIGVSKDVYGHPAYRLALQTREQHIRREKATSNICTAQALLATMAGFYAIYHGPDGLKRIAGRIHAYTGYIAEQLKLLGYTVCNTNFFDTLTVELPAKVSTESLRACAEECSVNLFYRRDGRVSLSLDETTMPSDLGVLLYIFSSALDTEGEKTIEEEISQTRQYFDSSFARQSSFLQHEVFNSYHTETELMRYIKRLERKDISLAHSMIPLGSCTMKLNAASELISLSMPQFGNIHPYAPADQTEGYSELIDSLKHYLGVITGLPGVTIQPNSGASGEYAGLRTIRTYLERNGKADRDVVILPASAHGTNPASAVQCGFQTVTINCDERGNVDMDDFMAKTEENKDRIAAMMITYPSTHGIFETNIVDLCRRIHDCGGQVYMDGANMNAQVGITNPGFIGADVCHLNLHKTFAIPHGGGGPGMGPICVAEHLIDCLPDHCQGHPGFDATQVAASPHGSAGIAAITYSYIRMLGYSGLRRATQVAILNANYMAALLKDTFGIVYTGATGRVGHELILECRNIKEASGIDEADIAKRLMDFGYHAPTLSFPVHGTLMVEPTESESKAELDRFVDVMNCIWKEIQEVVNGTADKTDNVLKNAPHPEYELVADEWNHSYPRSKACYPLDYLRSNKFWINVGRIDNGYGDRNLQPTFCACEVHL